MDEHGHDAPTEQWVTVSIPDKYWEQPAPPQRQYLPTLADLVDRLTIVILKQINIPENREAYDKERVALVHDIRMLLCNPTFTVPSNILDLVEGTIITMLANKTIWDNESLARQGGDQQNDRLCFTHSINGVRNRAKNVIAKAAGERVDLKTDCLASDLPKEFGNWDGII